MEHLRCGNRGTVSRIGLPRGQVALCIPNRSAPIGLPCNRTPDQLKCACLTNPRGDPLVVLLRQRCCRTRSSGRCSRACARGVRWGRGRRLGPVGPLKPALYGRREDGGRPMTAIAAGPGAQLWHSDHVLLLGGGAAGLAPAVPDGWPDLVGQSCGALSMCLECQPWCGSESRRSALKADGRGTSGHVRRARRTRRRSFGVPVDTPA